MYLTEVTELEFDDMMAAVSVTLVLSRLSSVLSTTTELAVQLGSSLLLVVVTPSTSTDGSS